MPSLNFWGICGADLSSTLHLTGAPGSTPGRYKISVNAPRGELIRELELESPPGKSCSLELDNILCELLPESGLRHALLRVETSEQVSALMRFITKKSAFLSKPLRVVSHNEPVFYPKFFNPALSSYLILANVTAEPIEAIVRIVAPNRAPELNYDIAPYSTKMINIETDFEEIKDLSKKQRILSYVRARCKIEGALGATFLEQFTNENGTEFSMVS